MSTWWTLFWLYPAAYVAVGLYLEFWPWTAQQCLGWANYNGWLFPVKEG